MSFLDAITAGFGAVVLLFMLVSQNALLDSTAVVDDSTAEAQRWELRVLTGQQNLVQLKERLAAAARASGPRCARCARTSSSEVQVTQSASSRRSRRTPRRAKRRSRSCARSSRALDKESQALAAAASNPSDDGTRLRAFEGEGNRQYLTGLRMGGRHVVILVDTSTSMLDRTIVNIMRRRNMTPEQQRQAPKWQQVVNTVDWLTTQIEPGTQVQIIGFSDKATWLMPGTDGQWVTVTSGSELDAAVDALARELSARARRACTRLQRRRRARSSRSPTTSTCSSTACRRWARSCRRATA